MTCRHGNEGFCYDDATDPQRERFATMFGHAYDWARTWAMLSPDAAEDFAVRFTRDYWDDPQPPSYPAFRSADVL
jgi:hypothetical protein